MGEQQCITEGVLVMNWILQGGMFLLGLAVIAAICFITVHDNRRGQ